MTDDSHQNSKSEELEEEQKEETEERTDNEGLFDKKEIVSSENKGQEKNSSEDGSSSKKEEEKTKKRSIWKDALVQVLVFLFVVFVIGMIGSLVQKFFVRKETSKFGELHWAVLKEDLPNETFTFLKEEVERFQGVSVLSSESAMIEDRVKRILKLPFNCFSSTPNIDQAKKILEEKYFWTDKNVILKDEIITCISLQILRKEPGKGNIICLVGSPGVGKTFFASVVAQALGKKFVSISLGGMHTESDLRGHRSTFVGAYPGGIVESLCTAGTFDPVILLDEIDKMGNSPYHGDPIAVLLKILDPNENHNFTDHYLSSKVPLDLSKVTFICTANREEDIPVTLKSRMKTILIADYDDKEKRLLLEEYLKPKVFNSDKVYKMYKIEERVFFSYDVYDAMVERVGKNEAGVRKLENYLSSVVAKAFLKSIEVEKKGGEKGVFVTKDNINEFSGLAEVRVNTDNPIVIVNK